MPILDPSLMMALVKNNDPLEYKSKSFFLDLFKEASKNKDRNLEMTESYIQFKQDLHYHNDFNFLNYFFGMDLTEDDCNTSNVYETFYSKINVKYKVEQVKYESIGTYYLYGSDLH